MFSSLFEYILEAITGMDNPLTGTDADKSGFSLLVATLALWTTVLL